MAWGNVLSDATLGGVVGLGGTIYNLIKGSQAKDEADALQQQAYGDLRTQLAFEAAGRARIADRATDLDRILTEVMQQLGAPSTVSPDDIMRRQVQLKDQYRADVDRAAQYASSNGFADNRARGMDVSTQGQDVMASIGSKMAQAYNDATNRSYVDAITQLGGEDNLLNSSRTNTMKQYSDLFTTPINAYQSSISNSPVFGLSTTLANANNTAMAAGSNQGSNYRQLAEAISKTWGDKKLGEIF